MNFCTYCFLSDAMRQLTPEASVSRGARQLGKRVSPSWKEIRSCDHKQDIPGHACGGALTVTLRLSAHRRITGVLPGLALLLWFEFGSRSRDDLRGRPVYWMEAREAHMAQQQVPWTQTPALELLFHETSNQHHPEATRRRGCSYRFPPGVGQEPRRRLWAHRYATAGRLFWSARRLDGRAGDEASVWKSLVLGTGWWI